MLSSSPKHKKIGGSGADSPLKYDTDFYVRKINRLEDDLCSAQDELNRAKVRLRRAQDYQIKYDCLMKQMSSLQCDYDGVVKQIVVLKTESERSKQQQLIQAKNDQRLYAQIHKLQNDLDIARQRLTESQARRYESLSQTKEQMVLASKGQIQIAKKQKRDQEQQYQTQIRQLKKQLHQKQSVQSVVLNRVQRVRREKDEQIQRLRGSIKLLRQTIDDEAQQKSNQISRITQRFQKMLNFELENIKKSQQDESQVFQIELNGLKEMLILKTDQIHTLLKQINRINQDHSIEVQDLNQYVSQLKQKIFNEARQAELQIINLRDKLNAIHQTQIQAVNKSYKQCLETLKSQRVTHQHQTQQYRKQLQAERQELQRVKNDYIDRLKERQNRINDLQQRIKNSQDLNQKQIKNLHDSFHTIETQKQKMASQYYLNVEFLNQQFSKLTVTAESRLDQIKQLNKQIAKVRQQGYILVGQVQQKWKQDRKDANQARERDRKARDQLLQRIREKQIQSRKKERQLQRQKDRLTSQNTRLKFVIQQLQKDAQRLNAHLKQLDEAFKLQIKKNQLSTMDNGGIRRELTAELDRQNSQLQAIKRLQVDQIRQKCQLQTNRLFNQNTRLTTQLLQKNNRIDQLYENVKQLQLASKHAERLNAEKLVQYQKKMATLNQQINLTQNMYQMFLESKTRTRK